ncbi:hypothetical protein VTN77DRAFT_7196 [Rasamsonia byssochlamydoides]|uniref:uncharacterized protein n=1 Tax=Rasamsonia byssochlamydoides TaxID=89139 RepID=UPI0037421ED4
MKQKGVQEKRQKCQWKSFQGGALEFGCQRVRRECYEGMARQAFLQLQLGQTLASGAYKVEDRHNWPGHGQKFSTTSAESLAAEDCRWSPRPVLRPADFEAVDESLLEDSPTNCPLGAISEKNAIDSPGSITQSNPEFPIMGLTGMRPQGHCLTGWARDNR